MMKHIQISCCLAVLLAGCNSSTVTHKDLSTSVLDGLSLSSKEWTATNEEDSIASTVKVTQLEPNIYKMVFSIDYDALDKGSVGYNGSNMGYFVNCVAQYIAQREHQSYFVYGEKKGEPTFSGKLPPTPFVMYLGLTNAPKVTHITNKTEISWFGSDNEATKAEELLPLCQNVFKRYPK